MKIYLAPMEGVVNARMRALLSSIGGLDRCVTEFVRVTQQLLPPRVFYRYCPELYQGSKTASGVPVFIQLLGSDPCAMADNAARAAELGAAGLDINFGCPAKTVNRHRGGSILLNEAELIYRIVAAVRLSLPERLPLTVKIRLGYEDDHPLLDVAHAIQAAGASELVVHARTKAQGYKPPAHWEKLQLLKQHVSLPVIANGEIWSYDDYQRCHYDSHCADIMLGRGLLAQPGLAANIKHGSRAIMPWSSVNVLLDQFQADLQHSCPPRLACGPVKQWLGYLKRSYPEAESLFQKIKRVNDPAVVRQLLSRPCEQRAG